MQVVKHEEQSASQDPPTEVTELEALRLENLMLKRDAAVAVAREAEAILASYGSELYKRYELEIGRDQIDTTSRKITRKETP